MCEYHLPRTRNPRWELPLVATDRFADLDAGDRLGRLGVADRGGDPDRPGDVADDSDVAADVQQDAPDAPVAIERDVTGTADDVALGDRVEAERTRRQMLGRTRCGVKPPGGQGRDCLCPRLFVGRR